MLSFKQHVILTNFLESFPDWNFDQNLFCLIDPEWDSLVQMASSRIGNLMTGGVYRSPALLEDYRGDSKHACHWGLPKAARFYESLRERLYGILLFEKPNALNENKTEFKIQVTEYCLTGPGSLDRSTRLVPILPPNNNHPGTVFENHRKSIIQHCERSELCLHFEWTKVN